MRCSVGWTTAVGQTRRERDRRGHASREHQRGAVARPSRVRGVQGRAHVLRTHTLLQLLGGGSGRGCRERVVLWRRGHVRGHRARQSSGHVLGQFEQASQGAYHLHFSFLARIIFHNLILCICLFASLCAGVESRLSLSYHDQQDNAVVLAGNCGRRVRAWTCAARHSHMGQVHHTWAHQTCACCKCVLVCVSLFFFFVCNCNLIVRIDEVFVKFNMGMCYNPLLKSWSWSNDESINYALYAQKLQTSVHQ